MPTQTTFAAHFTPTCSRSRSPRLGALALAVLLLSAAAPASAQFEQALERLEASPRHHEWATIETATRPIDAFVVYPESSTKSTVVVVIHENRGLNDWVRGVADRLAEEGYIAVAPDMLTGRGPDGGRTRDFASSNDARDALYEIERDQIQAELAEIVEWTGTIEAGNGTIAVGGFCWGGRNTFHLATNTQTPSAFFVFYGSGPEAEASAAIAAPIYGFYGENDARVNATIEGSKEIMAKLGKTYDPVIYDGAGHGFMRAAESTDANTATRAAADAAWTRWLGLLADLE